MFVFPIQDIVSTTSSSSTRNLLNLHGAKQAHFRHRRYRVEQVSQYVAVLLTTQITIPCLKIFTNRQNEIL